MRSIDACHDRLIGSRKPLLAYEDTCDLEAWREAVRQKLTELLGEMPQNRCPLNVRTEWEQERETFYEKRMIFS